MKKTIITLIAVILILGVFIGFILGKSVKHNKNTDNNQPATATDQFYGNRGNISQTEKIKFLSKNDEYLIGMMGLPVSNEVTNFSNESMIRFALNVAAIRYKDVLEEKTRNDVTGLVIEQKVVNQITEEYFGVPEVQFDKDTNKYYSYYYDAFFYDEHIEKTLYYYPVSMEKKSDTGNTEITADAIFVTDGQDITNIENARYEGKYNKESVDNTIKFIFNSNGKLTSYQYQ